MTTEDEQLQTIVYFLSDHVCTAIEAAEAIFAETYEPDPLISDLNNEQILRSFDDFHRFLDRIRHYEYLILTRLNQARHWATQLRFIDPDFRPVIDLFTTTTNIISDAGSLLGEDEEDVFNGISEPENWLEARGLIVLDESESGTPRKITTDENYLLGGKILLTGLIEVCESFHDALEARYAAFAEETAADPEALDILEPTSDLARNTSE